MCHLRRHLDQPKPTHFVNIHHLAGDSKNGLNVVFSKFLDQLANRRIVLCEKSKLIELLEGRPCRTPQTRRQHLILRSFHYSEAPETAASLLASITPPPPWTVSWTLVRAVSNCCGDAPWAQGAEPLSKPGNNARVLTNSLLFLYMLSSKWHWPSLGVKMPPSLPSPAKWKPSSVAYTSNRVTLRQPIKSCNGMDSTETCPQMGLE